MHLRQIPLPTLAIGIYIKLIKLILTSRTLPPVAASIGNRRAHAHIHDAACGDFPARVAPDAEGAGGGGVVVGVVPAGGAACVIDGEVTLGEGGGGAGGGGRGW